MSFFRRVLVAVILLIGTGARPAMAQTKPMSLDQSIAIAIQNSKSLKIAADAVKKAGGQVEQAYTNYIPKLNGVLTYTRYNESISARIGQQSIVLTPDSQKEISAVATLPVDISGEIHTAVTQSKLFELSSKLSYYTQQNQLVLDVNNAYFGVLQAHSLVRVAQESLSNAEDTLRIAQANLQAGTGTKYDVLQAETDVANAQQQLLSAKNQVSLANASFNNVLGLSLSTPVNLVPINTISPVSTSYQKGMNEAVKERPEVLQSDVLIRAAKEGIQLARQSSLPTMGLNWGLNYTPDATGFSPRIVTWQATVQLTIPLFDGGVTKAQLRQARADMNSQVVSKQQVIQNIDLEYRQAYLNMQDADARLKVANTALTAAREAYRLAEVRYKAGVSTQLELSNARTSLAQAESNQVTATYGYLTAKAALEKAIGRYAYGEVGPPNIGGKG